MMEQTSPNRPNTLISALSRAVTRDRITVKVVIWRLENEPGWTLEVRNRWGGSTVWETEFGTDEQANQAFHAALAEDGIETFLDNPEACLDNDNVVRFPQRG
jgi:hypothetical protein